ncbi:hypothetical protein [Clostridium frigidicarnis]|uniref:Uncharacterized protein n=1 Tax=Clostridium frigidicarnis TaxID=84698 RepID=A0A1I0WB71_9CLOT|nr:hypothetical protein [Clostridium frigidicarnis]SFA85136.1 hypothetical protein SAMN04488528_1004147 [Clostridium frigidicarnis]
MKRGFKIIIVVLISIIVILFIVLRIPTKHFSNEVKDFFAIRDDEIAKKYAPIVLTTNEYGQATNLYYRAAKDKEGNTYFAYHFLWNREVNKTKGIKPFLNRYLYTGGLSVQKFMYGKGDIEVIEIKLDNKGKVDRITFETPENYDPYAFSVKHKKVVLEGDIEQNPKFKVASWNHLFYYVHDDKKIEGNFIANKLEPSYFEENLWNEYEMFKEKETILRKNRAHYEYERKGA